MVSSYINYTFLLEQLCSENTSCCPMITYTIDSYQIPFISYKTMARLRHTFADQYTMTMFKHHSVHWKVFIAQPNWDGTKTVYHDRHPNDMVDCYTDWLTVGLPGILSKICLITWKAKVADIHNQLELKRLRSKDTPAASWLPILLSHIGSKVKRKQSQSYKL